MSIYRIEGGGYEGPRVFKPGDLLPAQIYTDSLPARLPIGSYPEKVMRYIGGRLDQGHTVSGLLEFQQRDLLFYNTNPEEAIEEIAQLKAIILDLLIDADAKDNVLSGKEKVVIPQNHMETRGGLRLLCLT